MSLIEKIISVNTNLDNDFLYSHKYIMDVVNNYPLIKIDDLIEKRNKKKIRCIRTDPVYSRVIDETLSDLERLKQSEKVDIDIKKDHECWSINPNATFCDICWKKSEFVNR